jgi:hypothetical protein
VRGGYLKLEFGAYLGFGVCDLEFTYLTYLVTLENRGLSSKTW